MASDLAQEALAPEGVLPLRVNEMTPSVIICADDYRISIQWREQRPDQPDHDEYGRAEAMAAFLVQAANRHGTAYDAIGSGVKVLPDHVAQHYGDLVLRIVEFFDKDETAGSFLREDGDGGFVGGLYRMAREIDALRDVLHSFPGFTDDASIGDPWIKAKDAVLTNTAGCQMGVGCEERGICYARAAGQPDRCDLLSTHTAAGAGPVGEAVAWEDFVALRIKALEEGARSAKKDFAIEELAFVLKFAPRRAARPVEEPGEVERLTRELAETESELEDEGVRLALAKGRAETAEAALAETRGLIRDAIGLVPLAHQNWHTDARAALTGVTQDGEPGASFGARHSIAHDGFVGTVIGHYTRLDGKRGVVLQQDGTKVVHVYGEKWLTPAGDAQEARR